MRGAPGLEGLCAQRVKVNSVRTEISFSPRRRLVVIDEEIISGGLLLHILYRSIFIDSKKVLLRNVVEEVAASDMNVL